MAAAPAVGVSSEVQGDTAPGIGKVLAFDVSAPE